MTDATARKQSTYLAALGIAHYVSRVDLPGAAPSRRVPVPLSPPPRAPAPEQAPVAPTPAPVPAESGQAPKVLNQPLTPRAAASSPRPAPVRQQPVEQFSLAAVRAGPFLWLEELPEAVISREQVTLIRAMTRALGLVDHQVQVAQFDWPMHNNRQLDLGEEAARVALGSFVARQVEQQGCEAVILLGEASGRRLGELPGELPVVATAGTGQMLSTPAIKRQVWQDLQPLRRRQE